MTLYLFDDLSISTKRIMSKEKILLKFGGSLITEKMSDTPKINTINLDRIGKVLNNKEYDIIVVHGAGSFGHPIAQKFNLIDGLNESPEQKKSIAEIREQMEKLNHVLCSIIEKNGMKTKSVIPSKTMITKGARNIAKFPTEIFDKCIEEGNIPITFGDATDDELQGINILSGDVIMMELARIYKPAFSVFVMDLPGVMDGDPKSKDSKVIPRVDAKIIKELKEKTFSNGNTDVTGGLIGKLECALEIAQHSQCWITNLDSLEMVLTGNPRGSEVVL